MPQREDLELGKFEESVGIPKSTTRVKIVAPLESNGAVPVNIQDQHTRALDVFFSQVVGTPTTLTTDTIEDSYTISVTTGHGILVGDQLVIYDVAADRLFVGGVLASSTNVITLDTPINFTYHSSHSVVVRSTKELNVDGSTTRQVFQVAPPIQSDIDITRIMFQMTTTDFPEMNKFGDLTALTRGLVLRVVNGIKVNYFNVKSNGELVNLMYDVNFYEAAKHGVNGLGGRMTYAGAGKHGVTIRLKQGDALQVIIQDDLSSLVSFKMIAAGHIVED